MLSLKIYTHREMNLARYKSGSCIRSNKYDNIWMHDAFAPRGTNTYGLNKDKCLQISFRES